MELWDAYDEHRNLTGQTLSRDEPIPKGLYHLVVQIWIVHEGKLLIQKRAMEKDLAPGIWAATGGSALQGEDSAAACVRETQEELGFTPDLAQAHIAFTFTAPARDAHVDVWVVHQAPALASLTYQTTEVETAMWATPRQIDAMMKDGTFWHYGYVPKLWAHLGLS